MATKKKQTRPVKAGVTGTSTFLLPVSLRNRLKAEASLGGESLQELVLRVLTEHAKGTDWDQLEKDCARVARLK